MTTLGISAYYHDSAAALVKGGRIIAAAAEERFNRQKHYKGFPVQACGFCLKEAGLSVDDLDMVVFYEKPFLKFERIIKNHIFNAPSSLGVFLKSMPIWLKERLNMRRTINRAFLSHFGMRPKEVGFCKHHLSHALLSFLSSPFKTSAVVIFDAVGEYSTTSIYRASSDGCTLLKEQLYPDSIGLFYSAITYFLGFKVNSDEYKVMGLAPYGDRTSKEYSTYKSIMEKYLLTINEDGSIILNTSCFSFQHSLTMVDDKKWESLFGIKRRVPDDPITQCHKDLALAAQNITEEIFARTVKYAKHITGEENLCIGGGCALNCSAIGKIKSLGIFEKIFVPFAPGDDGAAIGCAMVNDYKSFVADDAPLSPFTGPEYTCEEVRAVLENGNVNHTYYKQAEDLYSAVVDELVNGKIIGWFQGRMEFGPRALGNRSIIADARMADMKDRINGKVKYRESFRPFAPAIIDEYAAEVFEIHERSPYMMATYQVRKECQEMYPAITHIDGSARVQTVGSENGRFYDLLRHFHQATGSPLLLNTSFNTAGEPIVCSPEDALRTFRESGMDVLVIDKFIIRK